MKLRRPVERGEQDANLLLLSLQLRAAAADANRLDVIAKVDELMSLIAGEKPMASAGPAKASPGVAETVQRTLNGLGF